MNKQTITTQNTTLGQRLGKGLFWLLKQFIQAGLVLCTGAVTYALIDGTVVQGLAIPGMIVVMLLVGRFIYKPAFGTAAVVGNTMPVRQLENDDDEYWHRRTNPLCSDEISNTWYDSHPDND